ncbi:hypothetical protein KKG29_04585 [Patescibacteria group bacterium]|nr:hypothetical protein [Patescibacteria group bacterium]MBU4000414.1 hypothetical protein [Patescibacteria group bacterium]MBU4056834.1 hypothetical protein [Patescibacteria group bacterium]MBU4368312.1 hypothetical protein [Patescibacteria group bacterium]
MDKIIISKIEYLRLKQQSAAYKRLASSFYESIPKDSIETVVDDFRKTDIYSEEFLEDLESGLKRSSYAKKLCK